MLAHKLYIKRFKKLYHTKISDHTKMNLEMFDGRKAGKVTKLQKLNSSFFVCMWFKVWPQGLILARQVLYHLSHVPNVFTFTYCFK
jgi:hypothetical protein